MIELQNIKKSFDNERSFAVSDVSLSVEKGQLLGLIGESGSGKTTTLKMINRLKEPSSGTIKVNGTLGNPVTFRGDRLDSWYDSIPGQWDRIWLYPGSIDNEFN